LVALDDEKLRLWKRSLPVGDLLNDRWDRARRLGFGPESSLYDSCLILGDVTVGANTWIGPFTVLDGSGGLAIGSNCSISAGVHIYTHETVRVALEADPDQVTRGSVYIGDNCYIGPNAVISKGVTIGRGAVVGACSFVNSDVPENCVVFGVPARIRK
jgi:acetyltransferase-like isoleucine patch superfamily enzyme